VRPCPMLCLHLLAFVQLEPVETAVLEIEPGGYLSVQSGGVLVVGHQIEGSTFGSQSVSPMRPPPEVPLYPSPPLAPPPSAPPPPYQCIVGYCANRQTSGMPTYSISGTLAQVQAACNADPTCVAFDYRSDSSVGHGCVSINSGGTCCTYQLCTKQPLAPFSDPAACTSGRYCSVRIGNSIHGSLQQVQAACIADSGCVAIDYRLDQGYGQLCSSTSHGTMGAYHLCVK